MKYTFIGKIGGEKGNRCFIPTSVNWYLHCLGKFKDLEEVTIEISDKKPTRSKSQNSLYWVYLQEIENETGNESEDMHKLFKFKFLPRSKVSMFGDEVWKTKSTTTLTKGEFTEYLAKIERLTGVLIPDTKNWDYAQTK